MPRVWELAALVRQYDRWMDDGDALCPTDVAAAADCYWRAVIIKELIYGEAERFSVPLPCTLRWQDDLGTIRAFVAGGGWQ